MSLFIEFEGFWEMTTRARTETALRTCIGNPPLGEGWTVLVTSFSDFCVVRVKTLQQTRRKVFLVCSSRLAELIPKWLEQYPLQ